jgi:hypothetical protein
MPRDPKEYREHAVRCAELATQANTEMLKAHFVGLSKTWERLANELELTQSDVPFGSLVDIRTNQHDVRFTPKSGH